jgi:hypothetical protein
MKRRIEKLMAVIFIFLIAANFACTKESKNEIKNAIVDGVAWNNYWYGYWSKRGYWKKDLYDGLVRAKKNSAANYVGMGKNEFNVFIDDMRTELLIDKFEKFAVISVDDTWFRDDLSKNYYESKTASGADKNSILIELGKTEILNFGPFDENKENTLKGLFQKIFNREFFEGSPSVCPALKKEKGVSGIVGNFNLEYPQFFVLLKDCPYVMSVFCDFKKRNVYHVETIGYEVAPNKRNIKNLLGRIKETGHEFDFLNGETKFKK